MSAGSGIFNSTSAFESYLAQLTERLSSEREARIAFLAAAVDKLTPLLELAKSLQNDAAISEVEGHLAAARAELELLKQAS